jgi:hypothetical protein
MSEAATLARTMGAGLVIGLGLAYFMARGIWRAARAAGYLEGRHFLVKRRVLQRTVIFIDGLPLDDVGAVWIETNGFSDEERERIELLEQFDIERR